jgi:hypothetical protein
VNRDDRPGPRDDAEHDPLEYWSRVPDESRQLQREIQWGFLGRRSFDNNASPDFGQLAEDLVVLAGLAIRGVFLLVTWPVRWAWRRRRER